MNKTSLNHLWEKKRNESALEVVAFGTREVDPSTVEIFRLQASDSMWPWQGNSLLYNYVSWSTVQ